MKVGLKLALLLGFLCFIVGLAGTVIAYQDTDFEEGTTNIEMEKKIPSAAIDTLTVETDITGITFIPSDTDEIKVRLSGSVSESRAGDIALDAQTEGANAWKVNVRTQKHGKFGIDLGEIKHWITNHESRLQTEVILPDKMYKSITLKSDIGTLDLKDLKAEELHADTDTGLIQLNRFEGNRLHLGTDTGSVTLNRFDGKELSVTTDTGRITVGDTQGDVSLRSDTGSISASLREVGQTDIQSDTGSVSLQFSTVPASARFNLSSSTGRITLDVPGVSFERQERNKVKGTLGDGSKSVDIQTDTGSIKVTSGPSNSEND